MAHPSGIPDPMFRESVRDFMVNQQFRKDYWVKGARRVNALQQSQTLMQQRVILSSQPEDIKLTVQGAVGEAKLSEGVYSPIIQALADHKPHSVQDLINALQGQDNPLVKVVQALLVLTAQGHVHPVQAEEVSTKAANTTKKLNQHLLNLAKGSADISFLASPVTGGGIAVGRFHQLFLLARTQGHKTPQEWANFVWNILAAQGQRLVKEGKAIETAEDNIAELTQQAHTFAEKQLPILKALQVA